MRRCMLEPPRCSSLDRERKLHYRSERFSMMVCSERSMNSIHVATPCSLHSRNSTILIVAALVGMIFGQAALTFAGSDDPNICHDLVGYACQTEGDWTAGWYVANHGLEEVPAHLAGELVEILAHWPGREPQSPPAAESGRTGSSSSGGSCRFSPSLSLSWSSVSFQPSFSWKSNCSGIAYIDDFLGYKHRRGSNASHFSFQGIYDWQTVHLKLKWAYYPSERKVYWDWNFTVSDCRPNCSGDQ